MPGLHSSAWLNHIPAEENSPRLKYAHPAFMAMLASCFSVAWVTHALICAWLTAGFGGSVVTTVAGRDAVAFFETGAPA